MTDTRISKTENNAIFLSSILLSQEEKTDSVLSLISFQTKHSFLLSPKSTFKNQAGKRCNLEITVSVENLHSVQRKTLKKRRKDILFLM